MTARLLERGLSTLEVSDRRPCGGGAERVTMRFRGCARPQDPPQDTAQTRREPGHLRRSHHRLPPIEGAEPPQEALLHTPFKAVDVQVVAPAPGQAKVPRQLVPVQRGHLGVSGYVRTTPVLPAATACASGP